MSSRRITIFDTTLRDGEQAPGLEADVQQLECTVNGIGARAGLGLAMTLPLGKHSGRHAFSRACVAAGLRLDENELVVAFARFKARADQGRAVSVHELVAEVKVP